MGDVDVDKIAVMVRLGSHNDVPLFYSMVLCICRTFVSGSITQNKCVMVFGCEASLFKFNTIMTYIRCQLKTYLFKLAHPLLAP